EAPRKYHQTRSGCRGTTASDHSIEATRRGAYGADAGETWLSTSAVRGGSCEGGVIAGPFLSGSVTAKISVVTQIRPDLAAEQPVGPASVHQDHRQQEHRPDGQEGLRALRGSCFPQGVSMRHDHRPQADADADIGDEK